MYGSDFHTIAGTIGTVSIPINLKPTTILGSDKAYLQAGGPQGHVLEMSGEYNMTEAVDYEPEVASENTLDIRIAAVFVIFAAACLGGFPPLFIPVSEVTFRRVHRFPSLLLFLASVWEHAWALLLRNPWPTR